VSVFIPSVDPVAPNSPGAVIIEPIDQRSAAGETPAAPIGTGQKAIITTPDSSANNPVELNITDNVSDGSVEVAAATELANVAILGIPEADNAARVLIGLGTNAEGAIQSNAGSSVQVADYYKGEINVNYDNAIPVPGVKVDLNTQTVGKSTADFRDTSQGTIAQNAPGNLTPDAPNAPDFYIKTGAANDEIKGSRANDFIRAGAGDDIVNGGDGNDIIRAGAGSDVVTLGPGADSYYLTFDQFLTPDEAATNTTDIITDFNPVEDVIQLAASLEVQTTITGLGTSEVTITYNTSNPVSTLTLVSQNGAVIDEVQFV
jgi:Ca2+-binding RTX toxin-like protein